MENKKLIKDILATILGLTCIAVIGFAVYLISSRFYAEYDEPIFINPTFNKKPQVEQPLIKPVTRPTKVDDLPKSHYKVPEIG